MGGLGANKVAGFNKSIVLNEGTKPALEHQCYRYVLDFQGGYV